MAPSHQPPHTPQVATPWSPAHRLLTIGLLLVMSASAFENLAVATTLPLTVRELGGVALYGWAFSAFTLANLLGITLAGSEADHRGPAQPLAAGVVLFTIGLVWGGLAPSMPVLIASRAVQGFGAGLLIAAVYVAIGRTYADAARARMLALLSSAWVMPSLVGPAVAGVVAEHLGWRWVFLGIIPLPLLAGFLTWPALRHLNRPGTAPRHWRRLSDATQLTVGVGLLLTGGWTALPWLTIAMRLAGAGLSLHALRRLTPPGTLRARAGVPATIVTMGLLNLAFFGVDVFIPLALTTGRGQPPWLSGLAYAATAMGWAGGAWVLDRVGAHRSRRGLVLLGLVLLALASAAMVTTTWPLVPAALAIPLWGLAGLGMGCAYTTISLTVLDLAPPGQEGATTAAMQLADRIGTGLGAGLGGLIIGAAPTDPATLNSSLAQQYLLMLVVLILAGWVAQRLPGRTLAS